MIKWVSGTARWDEKTATNERKIVTNVERGKYKNLDIGKTIGIIATSSPAHLIWTP